MGITNRFATEDYVAMGLDEKITTPSTASIGQAIIVKAVDENGRPIEWECVDMGGGSGLPPVAETDNGKVLTVVNGVWTAVALPNAEEASF